VDEPAVDAEVGSQGLQVLDQDGRGVGVDAVEVVDRPRAAPAAPALVDADDEVGSRVEAAPIPAGPRPLPGPPWR